MNAAKLKSGFKTIVTRRVSEDDRCFSRTSLTRRGAIAGTNRVLKPLLGRGEASEHHRGGYPERTSFAYLWMMVPKTKRKTLEEMGQFWRIEGA